MPRQPYSSWESERPRNCRLWSNQTCELGAPGQIRTAGKLVRRKKLGHARHQPNFYIQTLPRASVLGFSKLRSCPPVSRRNSRGRVLRALESSVESYQDGGIRARGIWSDNICGDLTIRPARHSL